jgi:hypothetical protein
MKRNSFILIVTFVGASLLASCASTKSEIAKEDPQTKLEERQRLAEQHRVDSRRLQQEAAMRQSQKETLARQSAIRNGKTGGN